MPIHLPTPAHRNGGPDGQGWNRISLGSLADDECALRPLDYSHYRESQDTRRASYGGFGSCIAAGQCEGCPIFQRITGNAVQLEAFTDEVLVRISAADGTPWLMNKPEQGWSSSAQHWTWERLALLSGWHPAENYRDDHGTGFWLRRTPDNPCPSF